MGSKSGSLTFQKSLNVENGFDNEHCIEASYEPR